MKNYKLSSIVILYLISSNVFSQSSDMFDEDFLESLPNNVKEEIENENQEDNQLDVLLNSDTSLIKTNEALKIIRTQLKEIEDRLSDDTSDSSLLIERFGESFFSSVQSSFMPINIPNPDAQYLIGPGDKISIQIIGQKSEFYEGLGIQRDGSISIPDFGNINLNGNTLSEAKQIIKNFIESRSIGDEVFVTLSEMRDVQVVMLGSVFSPGIYTLPAGTNLLSALNAAGGINENGSFRSIRILRNNDLISSVDLYDWLIFGRNIQTTIFQSGDVIFVDPVQLTVPVLGGVNLPARYDIIKGETIRDAVSFAGGFSQYRDKFSPIKLTRYSSRSSEKIDITNNNYDLPLQERDVVTVPFYNSSIKDANIFIDLEGEVQKPGRYLIEDGETLSMLIRRAGGYKPNAYEFGAILFREDVREMSKSFSKRIYSDTINFLVSNMGGSSSSQPLNTDFLSVLIEEFKSQEPIARVITEFDLLDIAKDPSKDTFLKKGDRVIIPQLPQEVYMFGDFNEPVVVRYDPNKDLDYYIDVAGNKKSSSTEHVIVIDPDGRSHYIGSSRLSIFEEKVVIYPGSIIYLPRELGRLQGIEFAATVAPLFSSLALSLASISAINNN